MIKLNDVYQIGRISKLHGISGDVELAFTDDIFDRAESPYLVLEMDGILVPFFWNEYRFKGQSSAIFRFEGVDSEKEALKLKGINVYYPKAYTSDEDSQPSSWSFFTGFTVKDTNKHTLGVIEDVDDSSANILITIKQTCGKEILLPLHPDLVVSHDINERILVMEIPEGLIDIN